MVGLAIVATSLLLCTLYGLWLRHRDGRLRVTVAPAAATVGSDQETASAGQNDVADSAVTLSADDLGVELGERATLVQFSSAFCQPCRATRLVLADVADTIPGVTHVEIDAEAQLDLVRRLHIWRTPTVLVLNSENQVVRRATGTPKKSEVVAAIAESVDAG